MDTTKPPTSRLYSFTISKDRFAWEPKFKYTQNADDWADTLWSFKTKESPSTSWSVYVLLVWEDYSNRGRLR